MPIVLSSLAGLAYGFTAAICYAGLNTAIRFANVHMDIWHIIFYRSLFGAAAMVIMARLGGVRILGSRRSALCLLGFAGAAGVIALTVALIVLPLFEALVLLYLFPVFAALLSPWLTTDRLTLPRGTPGPLAMKGMLAISSYIIGPLPMRPCEPCMPPWSLV
ncbi:MAG: EamA family transporter [Anaerolineales bacterium]